MLDNSTGLQVDRLAVLRLEAEAALANGYQVRHNGFNSTDAAEIIHELHINQVELEIQSNDLISSKNELEQLRQRYHVLYEFAPIGYLTINAAGNIIVANLTSESMFHVPRNELIGKSFSDLISPEGLAGYYIQQTRVFEQGIPSTFNVKLMCPDGSCFDARVVCSVEYSSHQPFSVSARLAIVDISGQMNAERQQTQAEEADRQKSTLLAVISHELRSPLTSVLGFAATLLDTSISLKPDEERQFIEIIHLEATKLLELVQRLLEVSRLEAGALPINLQECSLYSILEIAMAQLSTVTTSHRLEIDLPADLPLVTADDGRIAQVIANLVTNAVKHSPAGACIRISAHLNKAFLQIEVIDEGTGIPADKRESMFEMFQQGDPSTVQGGAGLGLAICKGLVEAHGGQIWVKDQEMDGTTLAFTLPIAAASVIL